MQNNPVNMYTTLDISPASEVLLADEVPAITSRKAKSEKSVSGARNLIWIRQTLWDVTEMLQGIAGVFVVLYLLGAVALGVAVLFYTFSR
jgi:hypothetical protein